MSTAENVNPGQTTFKLRGVTWRNRKFYIAAENAGEIEVSAETLAEVFHGRFRAFELSALLTQLSQKTEILCDPKGEILNLSEVFQWIQSKCQLSVLKKNAEVCTSCGTSWLAGSSVLSSREYKGVFGCKNCIPSAFEVKNDAEDITAPPEPTGPTVVLEDITTAKANADAAWKALIERLPGRIFRVNCVPGASRGTLAYVHDIDKTTAVESRNDFFGLFNLLRLVNFKQETSRKDGSTAASYVAPPQDLVKSMLRDPSEFVPALSGIVRLPLIDKSTGEVLAEKGYDPKSRLFIAPDVRLEEIPEEPTFEDCAEAKQLIDDLLFDFPFASETAKSCAVGALFDQVVRSSLIDAPTPAYTTSAPVSGESTGKSLLAEVIAIIANGNDGTNPNWPHDETELQKTLLPIIERQQNVIFFDNVDKKIKSTTVDALLTSRVYSARRLGNNDSIVSVPFRSSIIFSSNGAIFEQSLARRMVLINLIEGNRQTKMNGHNRVYLIEEQYGEDIKSHVKRPEMRAQYVRAILLLTRAWIQAGKPLDPDMEPLHSFEVWSKTVPAIVRFAGWTSMHTGSHSAMKTANQDMIDADEFKERWWDRFKNTTIEVKELGMVCRDTGIYLDQIKASSASTPPVYLGRSVKSRFLGHMKKQKTRLIDGSFVEVEAVLDRNGKERSWRLVRTGGTEDFSVVQDEDVDLVDAELGEGSVEGEESEGSAQVGTVSAEDESLKFVPVSDTSFDWSSIE